MARGFELDREGVRSILMNQCGDAVDAAAEQVADNVRANVDGLPVFVNSFRGDRQAASVTIADESGLELQAVGGVLTRAASSAGLEVTS